MKHRGPAILSALGFTVFVLVVSLRAADPGVTLIGTGLIPGTDLDKSGLAGQSICQFDNAATCIDQATFGGFGSALAYTGFNGVFVAVPDRGPFDGRTDVPYRDRVHYVHLAVDTAAAFPNIRTTLLDTVFRARRDMPIWSAVRRTSMRDSIRRGRPLVVAAAFSSPTNMVLRSSSSIATATCCAEFQYPPSS